jgi:Type IV secretion system proteins
MKIISKKSILSTLLASIVMLGSPLTHAQFLVIDPVAIAQATAQVTAWGSQLTAMKNQYDQAVTMYNSVKGITSFSDVLNNTALMKQLPKEWQDVAANVKQSAEYAKELAKLGTATTPDQKKRFETIASNNAAMTSFFKESNERLKNAQDLIALIKTTTDPKEKQDLANQLAGAQAAIQGSTQIASLMVEKAKADTAQNERDFYQNRRCKVYGKC